MRVITTDGDTYDGATARDVIAAMQSDDWGGSARTLERFMEHTADRLSDSYEVRTNDPLAFLFDLQSAGELDMVADLTPEEATQWVALAMDGDE